MFPNLRAIEEHQAQQVPEEVKEIHRLGEATLARVEAMRLSAFKTLGYWNRKFMKTETEKLDHDKLFPIGPRGASDNAPKLKLGEVMAEKAIARDNLQASRFKEASS